MKRFLFNVALAVGMASLWTLPARSQRARVVLREKAEVKTLTIGLADLLPANAPPALREACQRIQLGHAPSGSVRVFYSQQIAATLAHEPALLRQISIPARVTVRRRASPISAEAIEAVVSNFLLAQGWDDNDLRAGLKLEWPAELASGDGPPDLQITGSSWDAAHSHLQVYVRCTQRNDCGRFLVRANLRQRLAENGRDTPKLFARRDVVPATAPRLLETRALAEAGDAARLMVDTGEVHISMAVICLQRGVLSQEIRVRDAGSGRVFRAEVLGKGRLRAVF